MTAWRVSVLALPIFQPLRRGIRFQTALLPKPLEPPVAHAPDKMILLSMILQIFPETPLCD
jgi:hypothetical protein